MTTKQYLDRIREADIKILNRTHELEALRKSISLISGIDYSKDRVQSTPTTGNKQIEKLIDLESELIDMIDMAANNKHHIINQIHELEDINHIQILYKRYIEYKSFEQISCELNYAYNYVCNLHGDALKEFGIKYLNFS